MRRDRLLDGFEDLYTAAVADSLDQLGYTDRVLPPSIEPLTPEMGVAGVAFPVVGAPDETVSYEANMRSFLELLGDAPADGVVTIRSQSDRAAHLGELTTTALQAQDCRGAVVDGGVRDVTFILEQEFPVFSRYRTPADAVPRWRVEDWEVPITVGDVTVHPGDIIVGDVDGVVCVPEDAAEEVLVLATETADTEDEVRTAVADGVAPIDAYERFGTF